MLTDKTGMNRRKSAQWRGGRQEKTEQTDFFEENLLVEDEDSVYELDGRCMERKKYNKN